MTAWASALVLVWPSGRLRVSSEHGCEEWHALGGTQAALDLGEEIAELRHLPPEGGRVSRLSLFPWEDVGLA